MNPRWQSSLLATLTGLWLFLVAMPLWAASLRTEISARQVGVGERVIVRAVAVQGDDDPAPEQPRLQVKGKAQVEGPSVGSQTSMSMHNFSVSREHSVIATWAVTPTAVGQLTIGPASFVVGGKTLKGETVVVEVSAAASPGRSSTRQPAFDPFNFGPFSRGRLPFPEPRGLGASEAPEELRLAKAPHPIAFLYALPSKTKVVVGEPLTLAIYAYGSRGAFREGSPTEPTTAKFLSFPVVEHSQEEPPFVTTIEDEAWQILKLRELVLVPLQTGKLVVDRMEATVQGPGYPAQGSRYGVRVESAPQIIEVVEPPQAGRPDGYLLGDVGRFSLRADVSPRQIKAGDYAQLVVTVGGTGNPPARVRLPSQAGLEWQEPTTSGGPQVKDGKLRGSRTIKVALRLNEPGAIELGEVTLPFYDASTNQYRVARAELGRIDVAPRPASSVSADTPPPPSAAAGRLLEPHRKLRALSDEPPLSITTRHWAVLLSVPALAGLLRLIVAGARRLRERSGAAPASRTVIKAALDAARRSAAAGDLQKAIRDLERALYEAIEETTGLKGRGILRAQLATSLRRHELEPELSDQLGQLLVDLEALRYDPGTKPASAWIELGQSLIRRLQKTRTRRTPVATPSPTRRPV